MAEPSTYTEQGLPPTYNFREEWEVSPREVKEMLDRGEDFVLIDCRTPDEYQIARIEGAELVPLQALQSRIDDLEDHRDEQVVIHCHHGMRSLQMAAVLRQMGFEDVKSMAGGIDAWSVAIDPDVPRY